MKHGTTLPLFNDEICEYDTYDRFSAASVISEPWIRYLRIYGVDVLFLRNQNTSISTDAMNNPTTILNK